MRKKILLTSFDTWLSHQKSNSSDDLLLELDKLPSPMDGLTFLRRLPVDIQLASSQVIAKIKELQPDYIICCGMAEGREKLSIEVIARIPSLQTTDILSPDSGENNRIDFWQTTVDVEKLVADAPDVAISYDCGRFVCEGLYYQVLEYLSQSQTPTHCIFIHVPILNPDNLSFMIADFVFIINRLALL